VKSTGVTKCLCASAVLLALAFRAGADSIDDAVRADMAKHPIPGLALEVIRDGQCIKRTAYGFANLEWQIPATPETVFEIGSVTKQFTAAGILLLAQDGRLAVDDPISMHLANTPKSWKDITIRNLMTHTSGIKNYTLLDGFELTRHLTQAQFIKLLAKQPLDFKPGSDWKYSNSGFSLLGYIIENVSGENYWRYMHERIFEPLGMTNTTRRDPPALVPLRANGYETDKDGHYINRDSDLTDIFSAGAIVSTVDDMAKWNAGLDAQKLLTAATEKEMWTPLRFNNGQPHDYGFGWFLNPWHGHENIGHSGSTSGFSASFQRFPKEGLSIIVLTNSNEEGIATRVAKEIAMIYLGK
jgi:D-alanyl-D-alanine carboxypeptidase